VVVQVESAFNPYAKSIKGALGLMQLMPATIRRFGVTDPFNPAENVRAGVTYLRQLLDRYGNDEQLALAAYNAGPGAVDRHGQSVPPYLETQHYVARINGLAAAPPVPRRGATALIYKSTDIVDGREVPRFSDTKPDTGACEVWAGERRREQKSVREVTLSFPTPRDRRGRRPAQHLGDQSDLDGDDARQTTAAERLTAPTKR
jgi:hypothetical protein